MKLFKIFGLVAAAGLALTLGLNSCKKAPAPAPETAAPMSPLPGGTTAQADVPVQPAPAAQPAK